GRELPSDDLLDRAGSAPAATAPEQHLLREEDQRELWRAVASLPGRCQILLRTMAYDPDHSYAQISAALAMPVGSIGPTRARALARLEREVERIGVTYGARS
nr:sigma-70 family RNA polymerase sigma factor [Actinomycetota bacterium]